MDTPDARRRWYETIHGIVEAMAALPETQAAFRAWTAEAASVEATTGADFWGAELASAAALLSPAGELVRHLGVTAPDPVHSALAFGLLERFRADRAAAGGGPRPEPGPPDFAPKIGRRFTIPEYWPTWYVREWLPRLVAEVQAVCEAVEKASATRGRPAGDYAEACRRAGRWYFLVATRRTPREALARERHRELGPEHAEQHGVDLCHDCLREIDRRVKIARETIGALSGA